MLFLYNTFLGGKKERFEIILEPLQAILQLALLSFTPIESKLTINNNILYIQSPNWSQGVVRSYYHDSKNDLFYLFNVFNRFNKFYKFLKNIKEDGENDSETEEDSETSNKNNNDEENLFTLLKKLATKGIDNLLQTYKQTDNPALLHTLNIYKNMLNNPEKSFSIDEHSQYNHSEYNLTYNEYRQNGQNSSNDIDSVFKNIVKLYSKYDLIIIFNTLKLIIKCPNNYLDYSEGLNKILEPINKQIQKWIVDNVVY